MIEEKVWWDRARNDLKVSEANLKIKHYYASSFFSQQAVEKALKALILKNRKELVKTHDLRFLAKKAELPQNLVKLCEELGPIYLETRYPDVNGYKEYLKKDSERDFFSAMEVIKWVATKL